MTLTLDPPTQIMQQRRTSVKYSSGEVDEILILVQKGNGYT
jgi:hypothetical protein